MESLVKENLVAMGMQLSVDSDYIITNSTNQSPVVLIRLGSEGAPFPEGDLSY